MFLEKGIKKTIRLSFEQDEEIKRLSQALGKSEASLIREAVDLLIELHQKGVGSN